MIATKVKEMDDWRGDAALYKLDPPLVDGDGEHEYVVVSAADAFMSGPETYIFAADMNGHVDCFIELSGSFRGDLCHETALANAGYRVA
jgi:hypothetical protein